MNRLPLSKIMAVTTGRFSFYYRVNDLVFIQRSRFGRSIFVLRRDTLEITSYLFGRKTKGTISLSSIDPDYELVARRFDTLIVTPLIITGACFGLIRLILWQDLVPHLVALSPAMLAILLIGIAVYNTRRLEYFTFRDQWKRPRFSILRERKQAEECDAFVRELLDRVEQIEQEQSANDPHQSDTQNSDRSQLIEVRWKQAIAAGVVAIGFPLLAQYIPELSQLSIPVVIAADTCGFIAGVSAFMRKEDKRYWALIGVTLCLVPLVL